MWSIPALVERRAIANDLEEFAIENHRRASGRFSASADIAQSGSFDMMIVPEAANMPPTPWQTEILAPGICAGAIPRIWRTLSCNAYMPYMPECMYERPPPLVLSGRLPPGAVR